MAYIRTHETKQRAHGKPVKSYAMVYRAKLRTDDGRMVTRLRQETHATKAAAQARVAELNAHHNARHRSGRAAQARPAKPRRLAGVAVKVAGGQLKARTLHEYAPGCSIATFCRSGDTCQSRP